MGIVLVWVHTVMHRIAISAASILVLKTALVSLYRSIWKLCVPLWCHIDCFSIYSNGTFYA